MKTYVHFWSYLGHFFVEWEIFQTEVVEEIKTHFAFGNVFFFENGAICEIMWKNVVEPDRPQMAIWSMRIAFWISKATNTHTHTHTEYVIRIAFPLQRLQTHTHTHRICNTYCFSPATTVARTLLNGTFYLLVHYMSCYLNTTFWWQQPTTLSNLVSVWIQF
jgi:hypothetical protein